MKLTFRILTIMLLAISAQAAQIGDSVESKVAVQDRINMSEGATAVAQISLDDGVWVVDGLVDFFVFNLTTNGYIGASLGTVLEISTDGTGLFTTVAGPPPLSYGFPGLALPGKVIEINGNGVPVYLVGWRHLQPGAQAQAWGFISARKIRNNH